MVGTAQAMACEWRCPLAFVPITYNAAVGATQRAGRLTGVFLGSAISVALALCAH